MTSMVYRTVPAVLVTLLVGPPLVWSLLAGSLSTSAVAESPATAAAGVRVRLAPEARARFAAGVAAYQAGDWKGAAQALAEAAPAAAPIQEYAVYLEADSLAHLADTGAARVAEQAVERAADGPLLSSALLLAAREASRA